MSSTRVLDDAPWLTSGPTAGVLELLGGNGEEARVVGGAVRNALLKIPTGDIDIATTALADEVLRRGRAGGIKSVTTGIDHGTVTLVVDAQPFEVTTFREDTETFGRKAKVAFGRDWIRDAERRDFTINGLSVDADRVVHDYVGGLDDIAARRVRFIGDPNRRIAEDYLRILRFFRIHAAFGSGEPDREGDGFHGPSLVAARRHGRGDRAAPALSARRGSLPRPLAAGMGAGRRRYGFRALARACAPAGALARAEISAQGGRFHRARNCRRPGAWAGAGAGRRRLAGGGFSPGGSRAQNHRRPGRGTFYPR